MAERITITVEPSEDHGGFLTVQDAMRQVLDFIEVVAAAASDDTRHKFEWRLVSATTNSPFTTVAEAVSIDPDWPDVELIARAAKSRAIMAFRDLLETGDLPGWVASESKDRVRSLLKRNTNGIGKTAIFYSEETVPLIFFERRARAALDRLEIADAERVARVPDLSGEELGSIEGNVLDATTHYGKPALRVRERLSGEKVVCVFDPELAELIGKTHNWGEVWGGQRVIISGKLKRSTTGVITFVSAEKMRKIQPHLIDESKLVDSSFTGGKGVRLYLDDLWDDLSGEN